MAVGPPQVNALFHGRTSRGFSRPRTRLGIHVPHAHRAQADWRARRSEAIVGHWTLRAGVLLGVVAARPASGESRRRQGSEALPEPAADFWCVRSAHVLPALRARVLRAESPTISQRGKDPSDVNWRREGRLLRHLQRTHHLADGRGRYTGRAIGRIARTGWRIWRYLRT